MGHENQGLTTMPTIDDFTEDQKKATELICDWYKTKQTEFRLAGFAGTGKSFLISNLPSFLSKIYKKPVNIAYCAYTGKACRVLNRKGVPANTIHSTIYEAQVIYDEQSKTYSYNYTLKLTLPYDLIIVDEASMVSAEIYKDIMSFGIPVIYVGDSGQLPPVEGKFNLMDESGIDYTLNQIHRQAAQSNIIKMSIAIRHGDRVADHIMDDVQKLPWKKFDTARLTKYNQIITGKNATRVGINRMYRKLMGIESEDPINKELMIFLKNNRDVGIVNGQQVLINSVIRRKDGMYDVEFYDLWDKEYKVKNALVSWRMVNNPRPIGELQITKQEARIKNLVYWDFSYCISVHKSQGDGWKDVCFIDDNLFGFDPEIRRKLLYTAVTRAEEKFTWVYGVPRF
jgi:exodeoxyribonuclease-5